MPWDLYLAVAPAVLQGLGTDRTRREPCRLVVDEATICVPPRPSDLQERVLDLFTRVAGKGWDRSRPVWAELRHPVVHTPAVNRALAAARRIGCGDHAIGMGSGGAGT
jgi:hypothetical protein